MTGLDNDLGRLLEIDHAYLTGNIPGEKRKRFAGLGDARACTILAAIELGRRLRDTPPPQDVYKRQREWREVATEKPRSTHAQAG